MSRLVRCLGLMILLGVCTVARAQFPPGPTLNAKAWILYDSSTAQVLAEQNADLRLDPGPLSRLMLAYVGFSALHEQRLRLDQNLPQPPLRASEGQRIFPLSGTLTVREALQGLLVTDATDAARALAIALAGNEAAGFDLMNQEARRLGLSSSQFRSLDRAVAGNASTARDLVRLATLLWRDYPEYANVFGEKEFKPAGQPWFNPNRLLWLDPAVDGLLAGESHLAAAATRGTRHVIAIVIGNPGRNILAQETLRLLNYGFQDFDSVRLYGGGEAVSTLEVRRGSRNMVKIGFVRDFYVAVPQGRAAGLRLQLAVRQPLFAPLKAGDPVGTLSVKLDGTPLGDYPLLALEDLPATGWVGRTWDKLNYWLKQEH